MQSAGVRTFLAGLCLTGFGAYGLQMAVIEGVEFASKTPAELNKMFAASCTKKEAYKNISSPAKTASTTSDNIKTIEVDNKVDAQSDFVKACNTERLQWKEQAILGAKVATVGLLLLGVFIMWTGIRPEPKNEEPSKPDDLRPL